MLKCDLCDKLYEDKEEHKKECKKKSKKRIFECDKCDREFIRKDHYNNHIETCIGKKFECILCKKEFTGEIPYKYHIDNLVCQKKEKIYQCIICDKEFDHKGNYETHIQSKKCNKELYADKADLLGKIKTEMSTLKFNLENKIKELEKNNEDFINKNKILTEQIDLNNKLTKITYDPRYDIIEDLFLDKKILTYRIIEQLIYIINEYIAQNRVNPIKDILKKIKTYKNYEKDLYTYLNSYMNTFTISNNFNKYFKPSYKYFRSLLTDGHVLYSGKSLDETYQICFKEKPEIFIY
jgi:hypothetical protein